MTKSSKSKDKKPTKGATDESSKDPFFYPSDDPVDMGNEVTSIPESKPEVPDEETGRPPEPEPEFDPAPGLPRIHLRVFVRIAGPKWDQLAGFKHYAKAQKLGPMTVPEWRAAMQAFNQKPTK